jgi:hypothetical protein
LSETSEVPFAQQRIAVRFQIPKLTLFNYRAPDAYVHPGSGLYADLEIALVGGLGEPATERISRTREGNLTPRVVR